MKEGIPFFDYIRNELDIAGKCRHYRLPLWQCPQFLFVVLGAVIVGVLVAFYFFAVGSLDPYILAFISTALAAFLVIQLFIVIHAFERIAEANRIQVEFMNIASHQLRDPVTAARWALDLISGAESGGFSREAIQALHVARDAVVRMGQLVSSIIGVVRIEGGTAKTNVETFPINDLVSPIVDSVQRYARAANVELVAQLPERSLLVKADREQVRFALAHLLDNAVRYTKKSGKVNVELIEEKNMVRVSVHDEGEGIPKNEQQHVFERFFRASNAYVLAPGGAGISLYVARAIIESLGGRIGFRSQEGKGSTFWFTLPLVY